MKNPAKTGRILSVKRPKRIAKISTKRLTIDAANPKIKSTIPRPKIKIENTTIAVVAAAIKARVVQANIIPRLANIQAPKTRIDTTAAVTRTDITVRTIRIDTLRRRPSISLLLLHRETRIEGIRVRLILVRTIRREAEMIAVISISLRSLNINYASDM